MAGAEPGPATASPGRGLHNKAYLAAAGLIGIGIGAAGVALASGNVSSAAIRDREDVETIVRDYVLAHPEIIPEAMQKLHDRQVAGVVEANRAAIETPYGSAWAGARDGDVVLVEFFDYACGYCRKSNADVERLLAEDSGLKVVWREWPVLGQDSLIAAEASLAAAEQGKFEPFFDRLFGQGRPTPAALQTAAGQAGVALGAGSLRRREEIERNHELARQLGATGTPTFVVGDQVLQGAVGYDALKAAIAQARKS